MTSPADRARRPVPGPGVVAVIFTSLRTSAELRTSADTGYAEMAERMGDLAERQTGYLGIDSVRDPVSGRGITVSYWVDDASAREWKAVVEHLEAQRRGRDEWYAEYEVIVAEVTRAYAQSRSDVP